ncbi:MAG: hypothetical protein AB7M12_00555 [Hyphomonadaceae bacterium]
MHARALALLAAACLTPSVSLAQTRADENVTRTADDAFGVAVGNERIGLYNDRDARGFNPLTAGNARMEGLYFDMRSAMVSRVLASTTIRVGLTAQNYPFPAPTGIVDYGLRTVGARPTFSTVVQAGPNDGYSVEFDAQRPIAGEKLGVSLGALWRNDDSVPGDEFDSRSAGIVARWRPTEGAEATAFYGYGAAMNDKIMPLVFMAGPYRPPAIDPKFFGQDWATHNNHNLAYGALGRVALGDDWTLRAGAFRYHVHSQGPISDLYLTTDENGLTGQHLMTNERPQDQPSTSGEARLTGRFHGERFRHTVHLALRARDSERNFGGAASAALPASIVGQKAYLDEPTWAYGASSLDNVRQWSAGAQYQLAWRSLAEASIGVQQVDYEKTITRAGVRSVTRDKPLFPSAALAVSASRRLALYANYTEGLEETPVAPENAVNVNEAPPAIHTQQYDFGFRYALTPQLRLLIGYFSIEKPYFNLDGSRLYRELGVENHSGYEISLSGALTPRLSVVAGAVLQDPAVSGEAVRSGAIGAKPVSQPSATLRLNLDYRLPWIAGLSIDAAALYVGERAASSRPFAALGGKQLDAAAYATLDLGLRQRFQIAGRPSTFRAQVLNVFDDFSWKIYPSGAFYLTNPRIFQVSLATDFQK